MSGMYIPAKERRAINHIVFAMDISSSVGREEHGVLIDKMEELREATPCKLITIVPFNNTVQQRQIVEVEQYDELPRKMDVGGGTSFAPVFNWIRRLDRVPDFVIMFTDLGSSTYGEEPGCPVLWASTEPVWERGTWSNRPPFGDVIEIEIT